jgi:hypothetical protein
MLRLDQVWIATPGVLWSKECQLTASPGGDRYVKLRMRPMPYVRIWPLPTVRVALAPEGAGTILSVRASGLGDSIVWPLLLAAMFLAGGARSGSPWPLIVFAIFMHLLGVNAVFRPAMRSLRQRLDEAVRANEGQSAVSTR